jgi:hypothetical protein
MHHGCRAVCAIEFSHDSRLLCAIGCDDKHSMGIWQISTGLLLAETTSANGLPPQVRCIRWSPGPQDSSYISQEHTGLDCDIICTVGERHLKFWSFLRPDRSGFGAELLQKGGAMGKLPRDTAAKIYRSAEFIPSAASAQNCDVVTAGDNGYVCLWRR